jgi:hypothetical protein
MLCSVSSRIQLFIVLMIGGLTIALGETARPPNALVYMISPKDGDTVTSPFRVQFGLSGMGVAPAGVETPNTGHHHLLIDANESLDPNEPISQDKKHLHFGAGQTEALIELPPGKPTIQAAAGRLVASSVPSSPHVRCHYRERELTGPTASAPFAAS